MPFTFYKDMEQVGSCICIYLCITCIDSHIFTDFLNKETISYGILTTRKNILYDISRYILVYYI